MHYQLLVDQMNRMNLHYQRFSGYRFLQVLLRHHLFHDLLQQFLLFYIGKGVFEFVILQDLKLAYKYYKNQDEQDSSDIQDMRP